jgi:hypothetical protein
MKSMFSSVEKAAGSAFDRTQKAFKVQRDTTLELYDKLKEPDFDYIKDKYGMDGLVRYVREMEFKKLHGGGNG